MKRISFLSLSALAIAALSLSLSCAGAPSPAKAPVQPEKQRKERIVVTKVPVMVKETSLYPDGLVDQWFIYKYDAAMTTLASKETFDTSRADPIEKTVTEVVGGRITADNVFDADGRVRTRHEFMYDQAGRLTMERVLDSKALLQSYSTYAYDDKGNRVEWKAFDAKGVMKAQTRYVYTNGKLVSIDMSDGSGARTGSIAVETDAQGLVLKRTYKAADGSVQKAEAFTYAAGKPVTADTLRADNSLALRTTNSYGSLGELLKTVTTDAAGSIKDNRTFEYTIREDQKTEVYYE